MANRNWTISQIPLLENKSILITGANNGLGFSCAKILASKGAHVIMACRNLDKGIKAQKHIQEKYPKARTELMHIDLSDLSTIKSFSEEFHNRFKQLDVLINNAGILVRPWELTVDSHEKVMASNYLGHYALTGLLLDLLIKTPGSRVVSVSSLVHQQGEINEESVNIQNEDFYNKTRPYSNSKLALMLFANTLQDQFEKHKIDSISLAAHPGASITGIVELYISTFLFKLIYPLAKKVIQGPDKGSRAIIRAATDPSVQGGEYYGPRGLFELWGAPVLVKSSPKASDQAMKDFLWKKSEQLTGVKFDFNL